MTLQLAITTLIVILIQIKGMFKHLLLIILVILQSALMITFQHLIIAIKIILRSALLLSMLTTTHHLIMDSPCLIWFKLLSQWDNIPQPTPMLHQLSHIITPPTPMQHQLSHLLTRHLINLAELDITVTRLHLLTPHHLTPHLLTLHLLTLHLLTLHLLTPHLINLA